MTHILITSLLFLYLGLFVSAASSPSEQTLLSPSRPHVSSSWGWTDCGAETDVVQIKSLTVSPDPPKPGQNLTVTASGHVRRTIQEGAVADVSVKLGLIKILTRTFDICKEAKSANASLQCPVEPGDHKVVQTVALPKEIPPAKFNVEVRAYNYDESNLMCANIKIDFMPGLSSSFRVFGH